MRKIYALIVLVLISISIFAQAPELISYQAVIRDSYNNLVINASVGMQISILQGSITGTPVYIERQFPTTNSNGLVSIKIGGNDATIISGDFSSIDWSAGQYFIKTETDLNGGASYSISGTSQILSVPYALHAKTAESLTEPMTESDPIFSAWDKTTGVEISESQISDFGAYIESETDPVFTSWNKSYYDLTNKPNIIDSLTTVLDTITQFVRTEIDGSVTNEIQNLTQVLAQDNDGGALQIKNIANPTDSQDVTTKAYVDMLLAKIEALEEREAEFLIINGFTDSRDGIHYDVIRIGEQIWMAQNLKATRYSDGAQIQLEEDGANWSSLTTGAYCWLNNDSVSYAQTYGALYNYYAVVSDKLCPIGWHVPSDSEWLELVNFITADGYVGEEGTALKSTSGWTSTGSGTDIYGFNALPGGERNWSDGAFIGEGGRGYWWSSTAHDSGNAYARYLNFSLTYVVRSNYENNLGFSVRCLRD